MHWIRSKLSSSKTLIPASQHGSLTLSFGGHSWPIEFWVQGVPAPQGSKRHLGRGILVEASKRVKPWRSDVIGAALSAFSGVPYDEPLAVELCFVFPRPKSHYGTGKNAGVLKGTAPTHPTGRNVGDIEKLARSTIDALSVTSGGSCMRDDSLVVDLVCRKRFAEGDETTGAWVRVRPVCGIPE
ncbi:MAG: RusA family crossover junction endodeoxyribonuclease [Flavobacteriia bacterium]|nr:RusA family crossover junction endodeoxyribonuclease [Flavobacteriia bacterium]